MELICLLILHSTSVDSPTKIVICMINKKLSPALNKEKKKPTYLWKLFTHNI